MINTIASRRGFNSPDEMAEYAVDAMPTQRTAPLSIAQHLMDRNLKRRDFKFDKPTTIKTSWQSTLQRLIREEVAHLPKPINGAAMVVERRTGAVRAYVGAADYLDFERKGAINYLATVRSPGSLLKPFIYAVALDRGLLAPTHVFSDRTFQSGGYAPRNFDNSYMGDISLRDALVLSRNIPAIRTLEMIGAEQFENGLRNYLANSKLASAHAGLSLAIGGLYLRPEDVAALYLSLADPSYSPVPTFNPDGTGEFKEPLFSTKTAETVQSLMAVQRLGRGFQVAKTGTSQNRQDAHAVLIADNHLVIVWFGTPDNERTEVLTGANIALPFADRIRSALGLSPPSVVAHVISPQETTVIQSGCERLITYPEDGEWLRLSSASIGVSARGNRTSWYIDGIPVRVVDGSIELPDGGAFRLTASDGSCSESVEVFVELSEQ